MSTRGHDEASARALNVPFPEAGSLTDMKVGGDEEGEPEMITGEAFAPSLEDLAQDWLAEPLPTESSTGLEQDDGSGALSVPEPSVRDYARAYGRDAFETEARAPERQGGRTATPAAPRAGVGQAPAAPVAAPMPVPAPAPVIEAFDPDAALSGTRRGGRRAAGLVALMAVAVGVAGVAAWQTGLLDGTSRDDGDATLAAAPGRGEGDGAAMAADAAARKGADGSAAAHIDDDLVLERFEVGLPGKGKTCEAKASRFSIERDRKLAACYAVDRPFEADKLIVVWERDGETVRRGVRDAPRAARMSSASYLSLPGHEPGTWIVKLERVDDGVHTELARTQITLEP